MNKKTKPKNTSSVIAVNRKARHDYSIEKTIDAGLVLHGWEVKSIRASRVNISDSYVVFKDREAFVLNSHFSPLNSTCTHTKVEPFRTRKLLLHRKELNYLIGMRERGGYTVVPLKLFWEKNKVKLQIALAKGKKLFDKRADDKKRDWQRQQAKILRQK